MRVRIATIVVGIAAAALVALPAAASARTKTVYAGPPPSAQKVGATLLPKGFFQKYNPDINAFFRHKVTINQGDTIKFVIDGFHTVDLPGKSNHDLPVITPGATVTGVNDFAGNPFFFNGHVPRLSFNPALFGPSGGTTYDGSARVDAGLPLGPTGPLKVKFTKSGTYKYFCDVHYGMVGYVVVRAKGKNVPSATEDAAALSKQLSDEFASAKRLAKTHVPANHVSLGVSDRNGGELFAMFPARLSVKAGTVVTFSMSRHTREIHTAAFGPIPYLMGLSQSLQSPTPAQQTFYPSDPGTISLAPTTHGNGFANTGVLDQDSATPNPSSGAIKFITPGTFKFVCLIHSFMRGTIVVH